MFLILCLYSFGVFAQNVTVRGLVSDTQGEPLIGVTVRIEGTSQGTITGMDGRYVLANTPSDATLLFSYVGTKPQAVKVNGRTTINITLVEDVEMLEDVVVVAYGVQKRLPLREPSPRSAPMSCGYPPRQVSRTRLPVAWPGSLRCSVREDAPGQTMRPCIFAGQPRSMA